MKYALVTGGSRGIGRAVCVKLAAQGYHVLVNYVSNETEADNTLALVAKAGGTGEKMRFDVGNAEETLVAIEAWQEAHQGEYIEVLVNNAGIRKDNLMLWMEPEEWGRVLNITLNGFYNVTRPLLKPMCVKKFGRIINMASVSGIMGMPGQCNYSAAKGGIISATKALAKEVGAKGVTVNAIAPGFIQTDMVEGLDEAELKKQIPAKRFGKPEEVAALVAFLASKDAAYITGDVISINGGLYT
ncbi:MAG: 3-oxoacyl-ACP reductase FabG [Bacteroidales bacterium]|nr:3-oxoacyl-ACP reductase FabG [Bacteroidales bacterium]